MDRDTYGVAGAPDISDTILDKIAMSDLFVADVSIINAPPRFLKIGKRRLTPNPNVLVELGFAVNRLGWDRILLVQNTVFGGPNDLPFDLRGRRIVSYRVEKGWPDRAKEKANLRDRLEAALRLALSGVSGQFVKPQQSEPRWWGFWEIQDSAAMRGGSLFIREVGPRSFIFQILVINGSHTGNVNGVARFTTPYSACACLKAEEGNRFCELSFRRAAENPREIIVEEAGDCQWYRGMGAWFGGKFIRKVDTLFDFGFLDELNLARLYVICGQFYKPLIDRSQQAGRGDNKDTFVAEVFEGGVRGMYTIMEGIVMRGGEGQLWAAYIDGDVVRYFTTEREYKQKLPTTIEVWRARFKEKQLIFDSPVQAIQQIA